AAHRGDRYPHWSRCGNLSGRIWQEQPIRFFSGNQYRQPRWGALHYLWDFGFTAVLALAQPRGQLPGWGVDLGLADIAHHHCVDPCSLKNRSVVHEGGVLCPWGHEMANDPGSYSPFFIRRDFDWGN